MNLLKEIQSKGYTIKTLAERWKIDEIDVHDLLKYEAQALADAINGLPKRYNKTIYFRTSNFNYILIGSENGIGHHATVVMKGCFATNLLELARQSAFVVEENMF